LGAAADPLLLDAAVLLSAFHKVIDCRDDNEENKKPNNSNSQRKSAQHTDQEQRNKETHLRPFVFVTTASLACPSAEKILSVERNMCRSPRNVAF
jgi:hypothetical protein